jgi:hypothetical protein
MYLQHDKPWTFEEVVSHPSFHSPRQQEQELSYLVQACVVKEEYVGLKVEMPTCHKVRSLSAQKNHLEGTRILHTSANELSYA